MQNIRICLRLVVAHVLDHLDLVSAVLKISSSVSAFKEVVPFHNLLLLHLYSEELHQLVILNFSLMKPRKILESLRLD